ncbi:hypothetical protein ES702_05934 [subsurface metagenome]
MNRIQVSLPLFKENEIPSGLDPLPFSPNDTKLSGFLTRTIRVRQTPKKFRKRTEISQQKLQRNTLADPNQ